jgi:hypothetical protein
MRLARLVSATLIALLALSCASANRLSRRSELALEAGALRDAYDHARRAIEKDPNNPRARAAYTKASTRLLEDRQARILMIAKADSSAAAEQLLGLADFRVDLMRHGLRPPADPVFSEHESAIRIGAAGIQYRAGERALAQRTPKVAWARFQSSVRYAPGYRDAARRIDEAYGLAVARVAILPFDDQAGVPGLAQELADRMYGELTGHAGDFTFTHVVDREQVNQHITVAELGHLSRADAIRIGRQLGANQVVIGRIYGMRASTNSSKLQHTIYRRQTDRDSSGKEQVRYAEQDFRALERERTVSVRYDVEVVGTDEGASLGAFTKDAESYARVVFTDFQPAGSTKDYCLFPPSWKKDDPNRAAALEKDWKRHYGTLALPSLLDRARSDRDRVRYTSAYRQAFFADCHETPVYLGGLPGENDMASIALDAAWQPVLDLMKELDAK